MGARGGYRLPGGLGLEVFLGYLSLSQTMTREQWLLTENGFSNGQATDYEDTIQLAGPMVALSASYVFLHETPLTLRLWSGLSRPLANYSNEGTFVGTAFETDAGGQVVDEAPWKQRLSIAETSQRIWIPFVGPEVRIGYQLTPGFSVDVGVALLLMLAPDSPRSGGQATDGESRVQFVSGSPGSYENGVPIRDLSRVELPAETGFGTFAVVAPTFGAQLAF